MHFTHGPWLYSTFCRHFKDEWLQLQEGGVVHSGQFRCLLELELQRSGAWPAFRLDKGRPGQGRECACILLPPAPGTQVMQWPFASLSLSPSHPPPWQAALNV
jgi:hypothetical protein